MIRTRIFLSEDHRTRRGALGSKTGLMVSDHARRAINEYLDRRETERATRERFERAPYAIPIDVVPPPLRSLWAGGGGLLRYLHVQPDPATLNPSSPSAVPCARKYSVITSSVTVDDSSSLVVNLPGRTHARIEA